MNYQEAADHLQKLQNQIQSFSSYLDAKEKNLDVKESQLRSGTVANNGPQSLQFNMNNSLGPMLTPGNIGDINSVIWPYWFSTDIPQSPLAFGQTLQTGFSVNYEAAFIFMSFTKVVYLVEGEVPDDSWTYLDPDVAQPSAPGLTFTLRDGSSSRQFYNTPTLMDHCGNPRFPTKFPRPMMMLPNQVMQISFTNSHPTNVYVPFITAFGYRMRVDQAQKLLSLVYG